MADSTLAAPQVRPTLEGHIRILRIDHWFKNVFVLPGIAVAIAVQPAAATPDLIGRTLLGLLATGLIASSNYVLNEILDAPFDRFHRTKRFRPVPSGEVNVGLAYVQWLVAMVAGIVLGWVVSPGVAHDDHRTGLLEGTLIHLPERGQARASGDASKYEKIWDGRFSSPALASAKTWRSRSSTTRSKTRRLSTSWISVSI